MIGPDDPLSLLGEELAGQAGIARRFLRQRYAKGNPGDRERIPVLAGLLTEAREAAGAGDLAAAAERVTAAIAVVDAWRPDVQRRHADLMTETHRASARAKLERQKNLAEQERQYGDVKVTAPVAVAKAGLRGQVPLPGPPEPYLIVACDGSWDRGRYHGWGFLASDGRWGARGDMLGGGGSAGPMIAELMAVLTALGDMPVVTDMVLALDSLPALGWLEKWARGSLEVPDVTRAGERTQKAIGSLAAQTRRRGPHLDLVHVRGHQDHHLNEAADMLAKMARRWRSGQDKESPERMQRRCEEIASAFLRSWYGAPPEVRRR